jgi:hypothetical protein
MKHIKRKFSGHLKVPGIIKTLDELKQKQPHLNTHINAIPQSIPDDMKGILFTDKEEMFYAFSFVDAFQGKHCLVPESEPTLVYFNLAQSNYRSIVTEQGRAKLVELLATLPNSDTTKVMHSLYDFLGESSTFVISLFMAMESAVNKVIPDNFELRRKDLRKTVVYDNLQVQQLEFKEKVKEVLPEITGKEFWNDHPIEWAFLMGNLKRLRDEIVHTKKILGTQTHYKEIYVMALNFDYKQAILYAKTFINYYHNNLVEECQCGADF